MAVLLLAAGTITGAIWADYAWGRYWGWDKKEVWALVSLLVYLAVLHGRWAGWAGNFGLAVGSVLGATAIMIALVRRQLHLRRWTPLLRLRRRRPSARRHLHRRQLVVRRLRDGSLPVGITGSGVGQRCRRHLSERKKTEEKRRPEVSHNKVRGLGGIGYLLTPPKSTGAS